MEERIDIEKIEEAALSAIDELFTEDIKTTKEDPEILKLEEAILALDWEFNQDELLKLQKSVEDLKTKYSDRLNNILLTITENIIKFLLSYKELAPPNTITVLGQIVKIFKEINSNHLSEPDKKKKIKDAYKIFTVFKQDVERIKNEMKKKADEKEKEEVSKVDTEGLKEYIKVITSEVTSAINQKLKDLEAKVSSLLDLKNQIAEYLPKMNEILQMGKDVKTIMVSMELLLNLKEELREIKDRIDSLSTAPLYKPKHEDKTEEEKSKEPEELRVAEELEELRIEEAETEKEGEEKIDQLSEPIEEEQETESKEEKEEDIKEDLFSIEYPYVKLFSFGKDLVALPMENIYNIYSISASKALNLSSKDKILLKELKSFWKKLKTNMRGSLKDLSEKELEKLEVPVLHLSIENKEEKRDLSCGVLVAHEDRVGILFLGKPYKKAYLPEKGTKINNEDILAKIETPEGEAILIDTNYLFKRE